MSTDAASFVPPTFDVPTTLADPRFLMEPLGPQHNERDYAAWTSSIEHVRSTPGFPWGDLARTYDAVLPMTYFTFRVGGPAETVTYVTRAVQEIRAGVGSDDVPIHVIGGLARDMTVPETRAFVRAVRAAGTIGASTYTLPFVTPEQWAILGRV